MDPIHLILPQPPNIPPVAPAPRLKRVDRDAGRREDASARRRRGRREDAAPQAPEPRGAVEGEAGPHIDVIV
jgi:hypothetical protein